VLRVNPGKGSHEQCEQCSHNAYGNAGKHDLLPQVGLVTLGHVGTQSINCAFVLCLLCVHAFLQSDKLLFDIAKSTVNVCHDSQFVANQSELSIMQKTNFVAYTWILKPFRYLRPLPLPAVLRSKLVRLQMPRFRLL